MKPTSTLTGKRVWVEGAGFTRMKRRLARAEDRKNRSPPAVRGQKCALLFEEVPARPIQSYRIISEGTFPWSPFPLPVPTVPVLTPSFPRSPWERFPRRSASRLTRQWDSTRSVPGRVPTQSVGTRKDKKGSPSFPRSPWETNFRRGSYLACGSCSRSGARYPDKRPAAATPRTGRISRANAMPKVVKASERAAAPASRPNRGPGRFPPASAKDQEPQHGDAGG